MPRILKYTLSEERKAVRSKLFEIKSIFKNRYPHIKIINKTILNYVGGHREYLSPSKKTIKAEYFINILAKLSDLSIKDLYIYLIKEKC